MTRFRPGPQLDQRVARRWGVPEARRLVDQLSLRVKANAPGAGVWLTVQDERVRKTHVKADGQTIPANLRFVLDHPSGVDSDGGGGEAGGQELARRPRDPALSIGNRINCRCVGGDLPGLIAEHVAGSDVALVGSTARATVSVEFPRIVESENPGPEDSGGGWFARSISEVATGPGRAR